MMFIHLLNFDMFYTHKVSLSTLAASGIISISDLHQSILFTLTYTWQRARESLGPAWGITTNTPQPPMHATHTTHTHTVLLVSHPPIYTSGVHFHQKQKTHRHYTSGCALEMLTPDSTFNHYTLFYQFQRKRRSILVQNRATCTPTEPQPGFNQAIISDLTSDPSDCTILSNMLLPKKTKSNMSSLVRLGSINPVLHFNA